MRGDGIDPRLLTVGRESKEGDCTFVGGGGGDRVPLPRPTMRTRAATQRGARRADGRRKKRVCLVGGVRVCTITAKRSSNTDRPTDRHPESG